MTALPILRDIVFGMQDSYSVLDLSRTETVTPQTMKHAETPRPSRMGAPTQPVMPMLARQMTMYALHLTQGGLAEQASSPMVIPVQSPTGCRQLIIKENVGEGARQRDEETTADNEGESELTELSMP